MAGDRKYKQRGYDEAGRENSGNGGGFRDERARPQGPRPPRDLTGPPLPRLVQNVTAARCYNCATAFPQDVDFQGNCPKCHAALHCCKQCSFFETSTRFQCLKPLLVRIAVKDQANECTLFQARVTVARDATPPSASINHGPAANMQTPRNADDARAAFNSLFKKNS